MILKITAVILALVSWISADECQKKGPCECMYGDGSGYSLKNLIAQPNSYIVGNAENGTQLFYSPCVDSKSLPSFPEGTVNDCVNGYTLCLYSPKDNHTYVLGTAQNTHIALTNGHLYMFLGVTNISTILLQCTPNGLESILYAPVGTKHDNINLTLFSSNACVTQIEVIEHAGFFSTFFLIFFIILFIYLVIGIVYNYFFVGARGFELIPHFDFWCRVWQSLKLGFMYVKNGCRIIPTEDSYDAI